MGRERAKRPLSLLHPEERGDEEEQMEKFFGLLRSIRATRECWRNESDEWKRKEEKEKEKKVKEEKAVWTPCFEWEDFTREIDFKSPSDKSSTTAITTSSKRARKEDESLGLKLSL